jgi:hypothetical protein
MADSLKFATKDLAKKITDQASPARLKFENDKIVVEAVVQADDLKDEIKGKEWSDVEKKLQSIFDDLTKDLEKSVGKKFAKADDEIAKFPPDLYGNFLRPINIEIEKKFEEHCKRIHLAMTTELQQKKKEHDVKKDAKVRVEFDFAILESSSRRVVSSSSGVPKVDVAGAAKDTGVLAKDCTSVALQADKDAEGVRKSLRYLKHQMASTPAAPKTALEGAAKLSAAYREGLNKLEKQLSELHDAIAAERGDQMDWKKRFGAAKPSVTPENLKKIKVLIGGVVKLLEDLERETNRVRELVLKGGSGQESLFAKALNALKHDEASWAKDVDSALGSSFSAHNSIKDLLHDVEQGSKKVRGDLQSLSKTASAK